MDFGSFFVWLEILGLLFFSYHGTEFLLPDICAKKEFTKRFVWS